jgi:hypothetical protein
LIKLHGVGENGDHPIAGGELKIPGEFHGRDKVCRAGNPQKIEFFYEICRDAFLLEVFLSLGLVEKPDEGDGGLVVDGDDHVGIAHVVDPGHVFIADSLDAVGAKAV